MRSKDWIWKDPDPPPALVKVQRTVQRLRPREYDGSHICFGGMNPEITLREHQKNAIATCAVRRQYAAGARGGRGQDLRNGSCSDGKKRLGLCQKSLFVRPQPPDRAVGIGEFLRLYPTANILVARKRILKKPTARSSVPELPPAIDDIIIGHSQFERIPLSQERQDRIPAKSRL